MKSVDNCFFYDKKRANKRSYEYSDDDAKKIIRSLQRELDVLKARFRGDDGEDGSIFSL